MKNCHKCKIEKELSDFFNNKTRSDGKHHWCKSCMRVDRIRYIKDNPERIKETRKKGNSSLNSRYQQLLRGARIRNLIVDLSKEDLYKLLQTNCYYCKGPLNKYGHGVDRYDNNKGYTKDNSVACCALCNRMKSDLSGEDFITHIRKIIYNNEEALSQL